MTPMTLRKSASVTDPDDPRSPLELVATPNLITDAWALALAGTWPWPMLAKWLRHARAFRFPAAACEELGWLADIADWHAQLGSAAARTAKHAHIELRQLRELPQAPLEAHPSLTAGVLSLWRQAIQDNAFATWAALANLLDRTQQSYAAAAITVGGFGRRPLLEAIASDLRDLTINAVWQARRCRGCGDDTVPARVLH